MRLVAINQSLWLDEAIGALAVRDFSYFGILNDFLRSDNHPPFYYLVLKVWTDVFGYSELSLRAPSILFGLGTVYFTYLIAEQVSKKTVLKLGNISIAFPDMSAILIATSQIHIYYSQEARMYSLAALFAASSVYFFVKILRRSHVGLWVLFSLSITVLIFTDYVPVFLLPVFWMMALVKSKDKKWWRNYLVSHIPILVLGLVWLPTFLAQAEKGRWLVSTLPAWKQVAGGATLKQAVLVWFKFVLGRISLINKTIYYLFVLISSIPFVYSLYLSFSNRKRASMVWYWLLIPLTLGFLTSFWFPAFIYFRFIYVLPAFYLLIAHGVSKTSKKWRIYLIAVLLIINIFSWSIYIFDERQQREQWKQSVDFIEANAEKGDIVIFNYPKPFSPYRWYHADQIPSKGVANSISVDPVETKKIMAEALKGKGGVYYYEYLKELSDPHGVVKTEVEESFVLKDVYDFVGVGHVYYYSR
jgi:hypothetical protein